MANDLKEKINSPDSDEANNPANRLYDQEFNNIAKNYDKTADPSQENNNIDKLRQSEQEGGKSPDKKVAVGDTAGGKAAVAAASAVGTPAVGALAKMAGKMIKTRQGGVVSGVVGVIVVILLAIGALSPTALLLSIKDTGLKWSTHFSNVSMSKRTRDILDKRYFSDPAACKGVKIVCHFTPGLTDEELADLKRNNLITDDDIAESNGKKYLKRMTFTDSDGKVTVVTKSTFKTRFTSMLPFRSKLTNVVDSRALITRGPAALKKFSRFGVDRRAPLGESGDEKTRLKKFRQLMYSRKNAVSLSPDTSNTGEVDDATQANIDGLEGMDDLMAQADDVSAGAVENGPKALVPDTDMLTATDPSKIVLDGAKGTLKGALMGFFAAADSACSIYNTIRILNFAAKAYAAAALIKYAGLFMTIADKQKSSEVSMPEVALLASALVRASVMPASKGKDFSQSQGFSLINYGTISRPEDLARFSVGTTGMNALNKVYEVFNFGGISSEVCRVVKSWWGQVGMLVGGILSGIFTLGVGFISGAVIGLTKALALSYIVQVMTMKLVPILAGTVVPDLATDPEGGYGAGNAMAAGMGAFGAELGKASGLRPLSKKQAMTLALSDEAKTIAAVDEQIKDARNPWDLNNPTSIPNQLAIALSPIATQQASIGAYVTNLSSMFSAALARPLSPTVSAAGVYTLDSYGGKYCAENTDVYIVEDEAIRDLARDANCNLIYGANPATLDSDKFSIDLTLKYMLDGEHIDPETGEATSTDAGSYGKWIESCVESIDPIVDKYSADLEGSEDPSMCYEQSDKVDYYRTYHQYYVTSIAVQKAAEKALGVADASTAATDASTEPTTNTGGMIWPIDKANWPESRNNPILSCKLLYDASSGMSGVHTGIDMMAVFGTPVKAAAAGKVTMRSAAYGAVNIQTGIKSDGKTVYNNYQHMTSIRVSVGDTVKQGQVIGLVGVTGTSSGFPPLSNAHLHFGTWTTNTFLSGHDSPTSPAGRATLSQMLHPMTFLPEDGRKVSNCVKPYVVP